MKSQLKIISAFVLLALVCLSTSTCGMKVKAGGRVVDAETGQPIEGAAVAIKWVHYKWGPLGLPTPKERLGTTETLTDEQGNFTIPRYLWRSHYMGVYKKGYIVWNDETIFNSNGKSHGEIFKSRFWQQVTNGMIIKLEPMPDDMPFEMRKRHASFTSEVQTKLSTSGLGPFDKAIKHEKDFLRRILRQNLKEK